MASTKGLTLKDFNWINSKCRSIAKMERHGVQETYLLKRENVYSLYYFLHVTDLLYGCESWALTDELKRQ